MSGLCLGVVLTEMMFHCKFIRLNGRQVAVIEGMGVPTLFLLSCMCTLAYESFQHDAFHWCVVPPRIDPSKVTYDNKVIINGTVSIHCPASGVPPPIILWYKDGEELNVSYSDVVSVEASGTELVIRQAGVEDTGLYTCLAANPAGEVAENFQLNVQGQLQIFLLISG